MNEDTKEFLVFTLICAAIIGALMWVAIWTTETSCHRQWERSGFQASWGPIQGCLISKDGKTFIPADNYREITD